MTAWVLLLLLALGKKEDVTPPDGMAEAIAAAAEERPLAGDPHKMGAVLVAIAWAESRYKLDAVGDGGQSLGPWQLSKAWHPPPDLEGQAKLAASLVDRSWSICKSRPLVERLGWYTQGGNGCRGIAASRWRVGMALSLLKDFPAPQAP